MQNEQSRKAAAKPPPNPIHSLNFPSKIDGLTVKSNKKLTYTSEEIMSTNSIDTSVNYNFLNLACILLALVVNILNGKETRMLNL